MGDQFDLSIAVIGAGMGGLGCALALAKRGFKDITVYEHAPGLGFVGAGIQLAPNMARILDRLGCWKQIYASATNVKETSIRQGSTDQELAHVDMPDIEDKYGYPHCTGHRADLAGGMYDACLREPAIKFRLGTPLVRYDALAPRPRFTVKPHGADAYQVEHDVVLGSDGIKSLTRDAVLAHVGAEAAEADTGQACYRIVLRREDMEHDPEMRALVDSDCVVRWIGEKRHIIAYPVANKTIYNMSSAQPDVNFAKGVSATYTTTGSKPEMMRVYADFCPLVRRLLDLVPDGEVVEWKLRQHETLPTWTAGAVALLGDACHPTLPHLSQGAAMAIEDGAVVAEVLARMPYNSPGSNSNNDDANNNNDNTAVIARALRAYERLRKARTSTLVDLAAYSGRQLHLGEGAAREERDRQFRAHRDGRAGAVVPDRWASPDVQKMIYEHDCVRDAAERFDDIFAALAAEEAAGVGGAAAAAAAGGLVKEVGAVEGVNGVKGVNGVNGVNGAIGVH